MQSSDAWLNSLVLSTGNAVHIILCQDCILWEKNCKDPKMKKAPIESNIIPLVLHVLDRQV